MKVIASLLLLVLAPLALAAPRTPKSPAQLFVQVQPSLVMVQYPLSPKGVSSCTGFVVDATRGWVLTAKHCINPDANGGTFVGGELRRILRSDAFFALIEIPRMAQPPLTIRAKRPSIGEPVVTLGYGFGILTLLSGIVAAFNDDDLAIDVGLIPGMSGGPIVDAYGEVVGLNQHNMVLNGGNLGVGYGVEKMWKFLKAKE